MVGEGAVIDQYGQFLELGLHLAEVVVGAFDFALWELLGQPSPNLGPMERAGSGIALYYGHLPGQGGGCLI